MSDEIKGANSLFGDWLKQAKTGKLNSVTDTWEVEEEKENTCEKHGVFIQKKYKNGTYSRCPKCCEEEAEAWKKKRAEENEKERQAQINAKERRERIDRCISANISPAFYFAELADYVPKTKAQEEAKKAVQNLIETERGKIIMLGSNGAGKTMLASIACQHLGGKIYTMYEISAMIRQSYTQKAEKSELEIVNELADLPFLVIDEIGRVTSSEAVQNWFSFILDKRHAFCKPTIIIGNLHFKKDCEQGGCPKCFENYFDNDILSRFHEETTVINIKCPDGRKEKHSMKYFSD